MPRLHCKVQQKIKTEHCFFLLLTMQNGLIQWNFATFSRILGLVACAFRVGRTMRDDKEMTYWILRLHWGVWKETGEWWLCRFAVYIYNYYSGSVHLLLVKRHVTSLLWTSELCLKCWVVLHKVQDVYLFASNNIKISIRPATSPLSKDSPTQGMFHLGLWWWQQCGAASVKKCAANSSCQGGRFCCNTCRWRNLRW